MKPFLGMDLTPNKKNDRVNEDEFVVAKPSDALVKSLEDSSENANETIEKSKLPLPLRIIQWICGVGGAVVFAGLVRAILESDDISVQQSYQNAPGFFWFAGIALVIWGILKLMSVRKAKNVLGTDESEQTFSRLERVADAIYAEFSVPGNAKNVDVLSFFYKIKNGEIKPTTTSAILNNPEFKAFTDDKNLYLANLEAKYAFPLSSIVKIHTVKKRICIAEWNKEEKFNKGIYKQYKLTTDNYGYIHCKYYYILEINCQGETFGIYIPCYELPAFEELTGLKATQEK